MTRSFADTNILVYAFDEQEPAKRTIAQSIVTGIVDTGDVAISTQVLQELFVTLRRMFAVDLDLAVIDSIVRRFATGAVVQVDVPIILAAMSRVLRSNISLWDALIVEAALVAGATRLLTEDLQHGQVIDGRLRIENPFLSGIRSRRKLIFIIMTLTK